MGEPLPDELKTFFTSVMSSFERQFEQYRHFIPQVGQFMASLGVDKEGKTEDISSRTLPDLGIGGRSRYGKELGRRAYRGICVGVGGIRGVIEAGAIHEFWTRGQLRGLSYYAGSSVGSMIVFLLAIGYEPIDALTTLCAPDFSSYFRTVNFMNLSSLFGLYPSGIIRDKLEQMARLKLGYSPSFGDLYERMGKFLLIPAYCLSEPQASSRKVFFSPRNTPEMKVIDAIILSCSIPIVFEKAVYEGKTYIDGAYTSTFPIRELETEISMMGGEHREDCYTLGIFMENNSSGCESFLGYASQILAIPLLEQDNLVGVSGTVDLLEIRDKARCASFNFLMDTKTKIELFNDGSRQVKKVLEELEGKRPEGSKGKEQSCIPWSKTALSKEKKE